MDISKLLSQPHHMNPGRTTPYLGGFASALASAGYTWFTINDFLNSAIHFGGWLEAKGLELKQVNEKTIKAFGSHRCECRGGRRQKRLSRAYAARVQRFTDYLREQRVIETIATSMHEASAPLSTLRNWLLCHRGLAIATVDRHERFITSMLPMLGANTAEYNAASVRKVILERIRGCRPANAKTMVGALRVYLRFLAVNGACLPGLDHALPTVAEWRLSSLPRYLDAKQTGHLIDSCRRNGPQGLRNRAIVLLLLRLGLRAGDIASMCPRDIDWHNATHLGVCRS